MIIMRPKENVCGVCSDLQSQIIRARTAETRLKHTDALKAHIEEANVARDLYQKCITAWHLIICQ